MTNGSALGTSIHPLLLCPSKCSLDFPGGSVVTSMPADAGEAGSSPVWGRSLGKGNGTPVFLPGKSYGQRILVGHGPWGHKESGTT